MITFEISDQARRWTDGQSNRRKHNRAEKTKYQEYLASPAFKNLRIACLAAYARNRRSFCFTCGRPENPDQLRVHHLRYYRKDYAPLDAKSDLVPVCNRCHHRIHEIENSPLRAPDLTPELLRAEMQALLAREKARKVEKWQGAHRLSTGKSEVGKEAQAAWQWLQKVNRPFDFFDTDYYFEAQVDGVDADVRERICAMISKAEEARLVAAARRLRGRAPPGNALLEDARRLVSVARRRVQSSRRHLPPPIGLIAFYNLVPDYKLWRIEQSLRRRDYRKPLDTPFNALAYLSEKEAEANAISVGSWRNLVDEFEITRS